MTEVQFILNHGDGCVFGVNLCKLIFERLFLQLLCYIYYFNMASSFNSERIICFQ